MDTRFPTALFRPAAVIAGPIDFLQIEMEPDEKPKSFWRSVATAGFCAAVWLYLAVLLAVWALIHFWGDRWWPATIVLFGPRWICAVPLAVLVPAAAVARCRMLWPLAAAAVVALGPVMGFCLAWNRLAGTSDSSIRVLTCNLKGHCSDNAALNKLIVETDPDIVALQGLWVPVRVAWPEGWHVSQDHDLLIASRYPIEEIPVTVDPSTGRPFPSASQFYFYRLISLPQREIAFCSLHLPSPHYGLAETLDRKTGLSSRGSGQIELESEKRRRQSETALAMAKEISAPLILAGDFNMPPDSIVYRQTWGRFKNAFSCAGFGFGHTEKPGPFGWLFGVRIDHILSGPHWRPCRCWVGPDVGSDHRPIIADLAWRPNGE